MNSFVRVAQALRNRYMFVRQCKWSNRQVFVFSRACSWTGEWRIVFSAANPSSDARIEVWRDAQFPSCSACYRVRKCFSIPLFSSHFVFICFIARETSMFDPTCTKIPACRQISRVISACSKKVQTLRTRLRRTSSVEAALALDPMMSASCLVPTWARRRSSRKS